MTEFQKNYVNSYETLNEVYTQWLYSKVGSRDPKYNHFWRIIRRLYMKEFIVIVPNDGNRYEDGMCLREKFADEYGYSPEDLNLIFRDKPCSVLEMLVAFAMRIDSDIMWDPEFGDRSAYWFWKMIENLGLDLRRFSDEYFDRDCIIELETKINNAISRHYSRTGEGGFFPIFHTRKNFQRMELWYQMHYWIEENFPI